MTLLLGVLAASLIGSVHCAAMCGSFVCLYAGGSSRSLVSHAAYNAGRLISYITLGLTAGMLGGRIDRIGALAGVQRGAAIVAGSLMIVWALAVLGAALGARLPKSGATEWIQSKLGGVLVTFADQPPATRAAALGLFTTLLPCGWLYTFVVTAGGTASPIAGAAVMFVFWLGTLPMLLGIGLGVGRIARPLARRLPLASAALVFLLGALSIAGRIAPPAAGHAHGSGHVSR